MRTQRQINFEIEELEVIRGRLKNQHGTVENIESVDAQIEVLEEDLTEDDVIRKRRDYLSDRVYQSARDAVDWLNDPDAEVPSQGWRGMVK